MLTMYKGQNNSPETTLTADIAADATTIPLASIENIPAAPNLVTIGTDDNSEVVLYTAMSGQSLVDCTRGFAGTVAQAWNVDAPVARCFTKYDHDAFIDNIEELDNRNTLHDNDSGRDYTVTARVQNGRRVRTYTLK